jgi:DNA-binding NarL/FixJ family response regulator
LHPERSTDASPTAVGQGVFAIAIAIVLSFGLALGSQARPRSMRIRVLMADDHQVVLDGLRVLLARESDIEVVDETTDGLGVFPLLEKLSPDILLLDLMMPGMHGLEVVRQAATRAPKLGIIVLSMHANDAYVAEALRFGARGYVVKQAESRAVLDAVRAVASGAHYLSPPLSMERIETFEQRRRGSAFDPMATLSTREREVMKLAAEGLTSVEIGKRLTIGRRTVETHRASIIRKLNVDTHSELVRFAVKHGIVE